MTIEQWLLLTCIIIEIYHVFGYDYTASIVKPITERHKWADAYKNITNGIVTLSEAMDSNPAELNQHINIDSLLTMLKCINKVGGPTSFRDSVFRPIPLKQMAIFLGLQLIEVVYWIIAFILACILPYGTGVVMFIGLMALSWIQDKNNKSKNKIKYWYLADSMICIAMYLVLLCM